MNIDKIGEENVRWEDVDFHIWKVLVDRHLVKMCEVSSEFLPDVDYRGMHASGDTPKEAAEYALEYARGN